MSVANDIKVVAHLDVNHEYHGGKLGKGCVECLEGGVSWAVPYLERDDGAKR